MNELIQQANLMGLGAAFVTGFLFSITPAALVTVPVILAYVTKARELREAIILGSAFVFSIFLTHIFLGIIAAFGGDWVERYLGNQWNLLLGPLLIFLGLVWAGWLRISFPWFSVKGKRVATVWGAFLLGIPFSVGICPACAPGLLIAISASAAIGSASYGALLLLMFAIGRSVPIIIGALSMGGLESLKPFLKWRRGIEIGGGLTLMVIGLYLLNKYFFII